MKFRLIVFNVTELVRIVLARLAPSQHYGLITDETGGTFHRMRINPVEIEVGLGPNNVEGARLRQFM